MKTIGIQDLPAEVAHWVRKAIAEDTIVTDEGQPLARVMLARGADLPGKLFPKRDLSAMPKVQNETSDWIIEDRNAR